MDGAFWSETNLKKDAYRDGRLAGITIDVTNRCLAGCRFCYNSSTPCATQEFPSERLLSLLEEAAEMGVREVTWGGGEPLLHQGIFSFIERAAELNLQSRLTTSGQPISNLQVAAKLSECARARVLSEVRVNLNTIDRAAFMSVRDTYDSFFDEVMSAFRNLQLTGFPMASSLSVCIVYLRGCLDSFEQTCRWAVNELGVMAGNIVTVAFKQLGRGSGAPDLRAEEGDIERCRRYLAELSGGGSSSNEYSPINCSTVIHVNANGDVVPCALLPLVHGNLNRSRLRDLVGVGCGPAACKQEIVAIRKMDPTKRVCAGTIWDECPDVREEFVRRRIRAP